ncbi:MAG: hypothetical protein CMO01_24350 [Thalassobius sp.]|nr:hypothetical protein [Thalassovita sp.]
MIVKENLYNKRIISIDAFRGITIFVMIFVNELAGVANIPQWMKHMPADADAMTFVDVVFPAFLFIVGMSIPFAFNARLIKGDSDYTIWQHTLKRTLALIIMGVYMVNASEGYSEYLMIIDPVVWAFFAYLLPIPVWNKYDESVPETVKNILKYGGILGFVALYFLYVQDNGNIGTPPRWWGILGLIGWAYLLTVVFYWFAKGNLIAMFAFFFICVIANCINLTEGVAIKDFYIFSFVAGHMTHASIVSAGVILSLLFFEGEALKTVNLKAIGFGILLFVMGYLLRPYYEVSKIRGTPSWGLYSTAICTALYYFLFWLMEIKKQTKWSEFFMPAAANPLLIYILPGIIIYFNLSVGISIIPDYFNSGIPGIIWCLVFSTIMLLMMKVFNKLKIRLHL